MCIIDERTSYCAKAIRKEMKGLWQEFDAQKEPGG